MKRAQGQTYQRRKNEFPSLARTGPEPSANQERRDNKEDDARYQDLVHVGFLGVVDVHLDMVWGCAGFSRP